MSGLGDDSSRRTIGYRCHRRRCNARLSPIRRAAGSVGSAGAAVLMLGGGLRGAGIMALRHSSGAMIAAAGGSYLPRTIGIVGASVAFLTSPITLVPAGIVTALAGSVILASQRERVIGP